MDSEKPSTVFCTVVAMDTTNFYYRVCSVCERTLPENSPCKYCDSKSFNPGSSGSKRLYRIFLSIASEDKVFVVILFDRAARVLFGCSADEFFNFTELNPSAAVTAGRVLEGEMFQMKLSKPKNGNAQHLRAVSVSPLRSDFSPAVETLKKLYGVGPS
ncbi:Replication factor A [Macleaya cordata]|uniref:Replication factor A n=1 Tax=Macleaya cordata TaxID=56857 RepID=A0A200R5M3_MACCD|nr:Replication factor A [Macleaya cordata]